MDSSSRLEVDERKPADSLSLNRRIKNYKECCYRAYASGLAAIAIVSSASYFGLQRFRFRNNTIVMVSLLAGTVAGYKITQEKSRECNEMLKAHRESMQNPVTA